MAQWHPQTGPQLAALEADFISEMFYGGERGGGKSDFQLGYQEDGALRYGDGWRGIMFRKTYPELEELQSRAMEIFPNTGAFFKTQQSVDYPFSNCWYWPSGASVKMRYIENEKDYGRYHGHQYCVGENTRVWMADGSLLAIKDVCAGDMVATLEGPRRVMRTVPRYKAPCVRLALPHGEQIQPVWHPVLSSVANFSLSPLGVYQTVGQPGPWLAAQSEFDTDHNSQAAGVSSADGQSYYAGSVGERQEIRPHLRSSVPVVLVAQLVHLAGDRIAKLLNAHDKQRELYTEKYQSKPSWFSKGFWQHLKWFLSSQGHAARAAADAHGACVRSGTPSILDWATDYWIGRHRGDGQSLQDAKVFRDYVQQQVDAAKLGHGESQMDETGYIPAYSHQALYTYTHPYTKELRYGAIPLELGNAQIELCGDAYVCDLTIEGVNHYVSEIGLVNKNTGISFDEVTEYATPSGLLRMLSTLRSANGVPCTVRLTGNPGGVGHSWVKSRYIDVAPPRSPYTDPETGFTRMFIPSRLQDNAILLKNDPEYRTRIMAATYGNEALRKAWLEGDWNIVAGAFFNCWSNAMVLRPVALPDWWTRFMSGDWGSARPYSFGWWAIAGDDFMDPEFKDQLLIPKGAMVRYREIYGCTDPVKYPNIGTKETAEEVATKIVQVEVGENLSYRVLDPAAFSSDGGPSIAERMYTGTSNKLAFRRADNARVATKGAIGGWDQMRSRMLGENGRPMLYYFSNCRDSIRTIPMLQHDENRIEDVNTDMEDHAGDDCFVAGTLIATSNGERPIEEIQPGELVYTRMGLRAVLHAFSVGERPVEKLALTNGKVLVGTGNHPVWAEGFGFVPLRNLRYGDMLRPCLTIQTNTAEKHAAYGENCMDQFHPSTISTTGTATTKTTTRPIWSASARPNIVGTIFQSARYSLSCANTVVARFGASLLSHGIALTAASLPAVEMQGLTMRNEVVSHAATHSQLTNIWTLPIVRKNVPGAGSISAQSALMIAFIVAKNFWRKMNGQSGVLTAAGEPTTAGVQKVYNLSVAEAEEYFAEGILVHNCRYACMSRPYVRPKPVEATAPRFLHDMTAHDIFKPQKRREQRV